MSIPIGCEDSLVLVH